MEHLEGKVSILAALAARRRKFQVILVKYGSRDESYREVLTLAEQLGVPVKTVAEDELNRMSHGTTHGGIIAVCSPLPRLSPEELLQLVDQRGGLSGHRASGHTVRDETAGDRAVVNASDNAKVSPTDEEIAWASQFGTGVTIDGPTPIHVPPTPAPPRPEPPLLLLIEGVDDARNLGFVLRTADAMGVHAVLIKKHLWDFDPVEVARPSSGAYERLPLVQFEGVDLLHDLKRRGLKLFGCIAGGKRVIHDLVLKEPVILAIGGEKRGLSGAVRDMCDRFARIPTVGGPTSLSMSHAAAIVLAEARRQRDASAVQ